MEINVGKTAGFCYGVKNAVDKSMEKLKENKSVCCLGEIVHNRDVVKNLENNGMVFIEKLNENTEKYDTVIRAHGVSKDVYKEAEIKGIKLIDLTCPKVLKIHKIVAEYKEKDYYIFLVGSKNHPEIIGTASFGGKNLSIIEEKDDIKNAITKFYESGKKDVIVTVQTTFSMKKFEEFVNIIKESVKENIEVINTICNATKIRQEETSEISKKVECMIIIGGKNSSNTKKLYEIAKENCNETICIENVNEIDVKKISKKNIIGIMAGASTPQSSINDVINLVENT